MISDDFVKRFAEAVAQAEGFYVPDSVPARAHNPGDLTDDGDIGLGVITIYASDADGWNALRRKLWRMLNGASRIYTLDLTLMEMAIRYSGSADWAFNVAKALGVDTRMTLAELAADNQETAT